MVFSSKTKKQFKQAQKLIKQKRWNEAIKILEELQDTKDIDQVDLISTLNEAKDGLFGKQLATAREAIRRTEFETALQILESLQRERPDYDETPSLIDHTRENILNRKLQGVRDMIGKKYFSNARKQLDDLLAENPDHPAIAQLIAQNNDAEHKAQERVAVVNRLKKRAGIALAIIVGILCILTIILSIIGNNIEERNEENTQAAINLTATAVTYTPTPSHTYTPTLSPTPTETSTLTRTPTLTATSTPTNTNTPTETGTPSNTPTPSVTNTPVIGSVNGNGINARDCPSLECSSITTLNTIDEIVILGEYGEWYWVALPNGGSAYVFGNLISLPDGAEIAVAPTLTPSSTSSNTPLPTSTPRPTQTQRPTETAIVFDEETLLLLVELALITNDLQVLDIRIQSGTLTVDMPNSHIFYTNEEYLGASLGGVSGAVVGVYREETSARSPTTIRINYKQSGSTLVSATFSYRDAVAMIDHNITEEEFLFERVTFR